MTPAKKRSERACIDGNEAAAWLEEREYDSVRQLCGSVSQGAAEDPDAFERANYLQTLHDYASAFRS